MTSSQRALAVALGIVVLVVVASIVWVRLNTSSIELSGERATLTPALTNFDGVDIAGSWRVDVTRGDSWRIELEVPAEIEDRLAARVVDGVLEMRLEDGLRFGGFRGGYDFGATIAMPQLATVRLTGASALALSGSRPRPRREAPRSRLPETPPRPRAGARCHRRRRRRQARPPPRRTPPASHRPRAGSRPRRRRSRAAARPRPRCLLPASPRPLRPHRRRPLWPLRRLLRPRPHRRGRVW